jgi:hypothetical protein
LDVKCYDFSKATTGKIVMAMPAIEDATTDTLNE